MLILASASPRRQELLRNARFVFRVVPADVPEDRRDDEAPTDFACRLARDKAYAIFSKLSAECAFGQSPKYGNAKDLQVLGADTIVVVDEHVLGKPTDEADAERMLRLLSGRVHEVTTGVCLIAGDSAEDIRSETTRVTFAELSDREIYDYIHTGEPMDKAGAYGIQGIASRWVTRVDGDYFNVVGLPVQLVNRMLR
jgi:septum formation protein